MIVPKHVIVASTRECHRKYDELTFRVPDGLGDELRELGAPWVLVCGANDASHYMTTEEYGRAAITLYAAKRGEREVSDAILG